MSCQGDVPTGQICAPMERCGSLNGFAADLLVECYTLIAELHFFSCSRLFWVKAQRGCVGLLIQIFIFSKFKEMCEFVYLQRRDLMSKQYPYIRCLAIVYFFEKLVWIVFLGFFSLLVAWLTSYLMLRYL